MYTCTCTCTLHVRIYIYIPWEKYTTCLHTCTLYTYTYMYYYTCTCTYMYVHVYYHYESKRLCTSLAAMATAHKSTTNTLVYILHASQSIDQLKDECLPIHLFTALTPYSSIIHVPLLPTSARNPWQQSN